MAAKELASVPGLPSAQMLTMARRPFGIEASSLAAMLAMHPPGFRTGQALRQQRLAFLPLPQGHGSLRPTWRHGFVAGTLSGSGRRPVMAGGENSSSSPV